MKGISEALIHELRLEASRGANVPSLLGMPHARLGPESAYSTAVTRYFMRAFNLPLSAAAVIGGWSLDREGEVTDARIQEMLHPEMLARKPSWAIPEE